MVALDRSLMIDTLIEHGSLVRRSGSHDAAGRLLFIHGLGESGLCFEGIMGHPALAGWQHLAPDLPGYGRSVPDAGPFSLDAIAEWLMSWVTRDPLVLVGHSMGGVIAQLMCEQYPDRFAGFINVEGNISIHDCIYSNQAAPFSRKDFLESEFDNMRERAAASKQPAVQIYLQSLDMCNAESFYVNSCELVDVSGKEQLADRMSALSIPKTYLLGDPGGTGKHSQKLLRNAGVEYRAIQPAGHWVFIDQPDQFTEEARSFLDSL